MSTTEFDILYGNKSFWNLPKNYIGGVPQPVSEGIHFTAYNSPKKGIDIHTNEDIIIIIGVMRSDYNPMTCLFKKANGGGIYWWRVKIGGIFERPLTNKEVYEDRAKQYNDKIKKLNWIQRLKVLLKTGKLYITETYNIPYSLSIREYNLIRDKKLIKVKCKNCNNVIAVPPIHESDFQCHICGLKKEN